MYVVSCRRDFESNVLFSKAHIYRNYTNPGDHTEFKTIDLNALLDAAKSKHVCLLVHGFNNPIENVVKSYWELVKGLDQPGLNGPTGYGLVIGFTWPGSRTAFGYFGAVPKANRSAAFLRDLINALRGVALTVDVQTHSLGARVAFKALASPKKTFVDNLMVTAPAVDNNLLEPEQAFFEALGSCNRCFVYHSKKDPVLAGSFWIGDILDGIHAALGLKGPRLKKITLEKSPNVYVVDCSSRVSTHGGYRQTASYYGHWVDVLSGTAMNRYDELS
ncbi:MAG: alpha/beta hydrolase [Acidobacteria bacterium]|nr:alpha/beta hydrolase [Acidobacteriota bacterium]